MEPTPCNPEEILDEILDNAIDANVPGVNPPGEIDSIETQDDVYSIVDKTNAKILLKFLAPQVEKNEEKKRKHKDVLIKYTSIFLGAQFIVVFVLVSSILGSIIYFHYEGNDYSLELLKIIFAFFGTYITSVVVELIAMLKYIVTRVFDTSITSLMEIFHAQNKKDKKHRPSN